MKILLLSRYDRLGASSRVRSFQYLPHLRSRGLTVYVHPLFSDDYLKALYIGKSIWIHVVPAYLRRVFNLLTARCYDLLWVEKELLPFMPPIFELFVARLGIPMVADYDDALFHKYDCHRLWFVRRLLGKKIDAVMRHAALVIAGNSYLARRAERAGAKRVEIVPTVIDLDRYSSMSCPSKDNDSIRIGWIGTPATSRYLYQLKPVMERLSNNPNLVFIAIGAGKEMEEQLPVKVLPWSAETEVEQICSFDIGIMPLMDSPWERGKCGYKLIQYMACGLPVVASPVGVNTEIVKNGRNGFLAENEHQWKQALETLAGNRDLRLEMGRIGRKKVEEWYCVQVQMPRLATFLEQAGATSHKF